VKNIFGAAVVIADIIAGMAAPAILANLHRHPHANVAGAVVIYAVLAVATLWVITSMVRTTSGGSEGNGNGTPRARYTFGQHGPRR
jgi:membrane protein implicated in regulation of membrane protease activity